MHDINQFTGYVQLCIIGKEDETETHEIKTKELIKNY